MRTRDGQAAIEDMLSAGPLVHGPADLVALNAREVLLVQVKHAGQSLRLALTALAQVPTPPHTRKQVWVYEPARGRIAAHWRIIDTQRRKA